MRCILVAAAAWSWCEAIQHRETAGLRLQTILNRVQKHGSFAYRDGRLLEEAGRLVCEVDVIPSKRRPGYDRLAPRRSEFVPLWGILVFFVYMMRRVDCPTCGVVVEEVPWASGKGHLTTTYAWSLARWAKLVDDRHVCVTPSPGDLVDTDGGDSGEVDVVTSPRDRVLHRSVRRVPTGMEGPGDLQPVRGSTATPLVGPERRVRTLLRFFRWFGRQRTAELRFVCSDMWKPYLKVIAKKAGLKEDLQGFWEDIAPHWAGKFMDRWCTRAMRSQLEPMKRVARMLRAHRPLILKWVRIFWFGPKPHDAECWPTLEVRPPPISGTKP